MACGRVEDSDRGLGGRRRPPPLQLRDHGSAGRQVRGSLLHLQGGGGPSLTCPVVLIAQPDTAVSAAGFPHKHAVSAMKMMEVVPASVYLEAHRVWGWSVCILPTGNSKVHPLSPRWPVSLIP